MGSGCKKLFCSLGFPESDEAVCVVLRVFWSVIKRECILEYMGWLRSTSKDEMVSKVQKEAENYFLCTGVANSKTIPLLQEFFLDSRDFQKRKRVIIKERLRIRISQTRNNILKIYVNVFKSILENIPSGMFQK